MKATKRRNWRSTQCTVLTSIKMKYVSNGDWFDKGTEVKLIDDYRTDPKHPMDIGLFEGMRQGRLDQEVCPFDEFEEVEESK